MKKIITLAVCFLLLCSFCLPVYAYPNEAAMEQAKSMVREAKSWLDDEDYMYAAMYYCCAGSSFMLCPYYYELAAHAYGLSATIYEEHNDQGNASTMRAWQEDCINQASKTKGQVPVSEIFDGFTLKEDGSVGSVFSKGNITVIVGVAAAIVFGLGGFFVGKVAGKKKTALADEE